MMKPLKYYGKCEMSKKYSILYIYSLIIEDKVGKMNLGGNNR